MLGAGVIQAVDYVTDLLVTDPILGWPFAIFFALALFALTAFATGEIADMRRLSTARGAPAPPPTASPSRSCMARPSRC